MIQNVRGFDRDRTTNSMISLDDKFYRIKIFIGLQSRDGDGENVKM